MQFGAVNRFDESTEGGGGQAGIHDDACVSHQKWLSILRPDHMWAQAQITYLLTTFNSFSPLSLTLLQKNNNSGNNNNNNKMHRYSWGSGHSHSSSTSLHSSATLGLGSSGKDDLWAAIQTNYNYIMDTNLLDTCKEARFEIEEAQPSSREAKFQGSQLHVSKKRVCTVATAGVQ